MSTIADYSVFTKAFLASNNVDFSKLYGTMTLPGGGEGFRAFAVIPFNIETPLTPREAMNFDWSKLGLTSASGPASGPVSYMPQRVSCRDADGHFIGNIVRVQPSQRGGSIRLVAKVAVPGFVSSESESNPADAPYNTFVLVRTDASTNIDLPIAVATISKGYNLHKHKVVHNVADQFDIQFSDPLDDVENANYVSFTINNLNGYTSVDFNPDAYATYDDVANALSRGIDGLHIAFNSNTGDIILSDSKGNVIDQANLHLDLSADTIIAEGEEGYKYVKTDINQNVHSAKAFMPSNSSAFGEVIAVPYTTKHASLIHEGPNEGNGCNGIRVHWTEGTVGTESYKSHEVIFGIFLKGENGSEGTDPSKKYLAWYRQQLQPIGEDPISTGLFRTASGDLIEVTNPDSSKIYPNQPKFSDSTEQLVYNHDVFVHTVGNSSLGDWDKCFKLMGFHNGDDIPLGTNLPALMQKLSEGNGYLDPEEFIHGADADNAAKVVEQRELAKAEMVEYNKRRPALGENRQQGTIIDHTGLDVRNGSITLGCGRIGKEGAFQKVNYSIQMRERYGVDQNTYESLDFTVSHHTGLVEFDDNGHAVHLDGNGQHGPLTSSTLLSIESGSYISGAPTCLILAEVTHNSSSEGSPTLLMPVRMTAGFSVESSYDASSGLTLTISDNRDNIKAILNPDGNTETAPSIIEVQAIYTHSNAQSETVPAQQMHTYIGEWNYGEHPTCSFLCNKVEEWMTAVGLADTNPDEGVKLYVVIRVY